MSSATNYEVSTPTLDHVMSTEPTLSITGYDARMTATARYIQFYAEATRTLAHSQATWQDTEQSEEQLNGFNPPNLLSEVEDMLGHSRDTYKPRGSTNAPPAEHGIGVSPRPQFKRPLAPRRLNRKK